MADSWVMPRSTLATISTPCAESQPAGLRTPRIERKPLRPLRLRVEIVIIATFYLTYSAIRNAIPQQEAIAQAHARAVWGFEQGLGLAFERSVNHALNALPWVIVPMNYYYATLHFLVTGSILVWLYRSRPQWFAPLRTALIGATGIALVVFYLYPLAPPRLMADGGFIDTILVHHTWGALATAGNDNPTNPFAAMPSMHCGWALWCSIAIICAAQRPWVKWVSLMHPLLTIIVIIATANHYWLDALGGIVTVLIGCGIAGIIYFQRKPIPRSTPEIRELALSVK